MKLRAPATIDNPPTHDPQKQAPMTMSATDIPARFAGAPARQNRTHEMHLIQEALARAHVQERLYEAESERVARRLLRARRLQRRAERASLRARRALALVVMQ
ncbi:hypothetical protein ACFOSC_03250 [Streptantibioticus rubrisoli]|uniref:Uncharacterized protein n=1 Tax=Streptantibioticus rubrisoli TaxID=1387313 RepID=A0ABT1PF96_9ACTN|nr:hypothetical protein [Streptantibioticus rubrisoli]MCQ4042898.1 hypothetical protein [Streptantibioticus rubrisoli]